jgi:hypothetical protein
VPVQGASDISKNGFGGQGYFQVRISVF